MSQQPDNELFTVEEVAGALTRQAGVVTSAAKALNCAPNTIYRYLREYPELKQVRAEAKTATIDLAEAMLITKIKEGHMTAIIFYLKTQAKDRGYVERRELAGPDGAGIPVDVHSPDLSQLSADERDTMRRMLKKLPTIATVPDAKPTDT
jgi:hypothetical protein